MNLNYYISIIKEGKAYATRIPLRLEPTSFIEDHMAAAHFPLRKLDISSYEGKVIIISDNNGYQARIRGVLNEELSEELFKASVINNFNLDNIENKLT